MLLRRLKSLLIARSLNRVRAELAANQENLTETERDYVVNYPTDNSVERILSMRKRDVSLREERDYLEAEERELAQSRS